MPLVGGNELSSFSISLTICFYLVINGSSVCTAAGRGLLSAAACQPWLFYKTLHQIMHIIQWQLLSAAAKLNVFSHNSAV